MRARLLVGFALAALFSFMGEAMATEPWADLTVKECKQAPDADDAGPQDREDLQALKTAIFLATSCTSVADCLCPYQPACYCTAAHRCICNQNLCCPSGECP